MKRLKKITSILLLSIALLFSGICITDIREVNAATSSEWKNTAIVAPLQDSLIGAGYIDIKWSNTLDNVSKYTVYFDGALIKTVNPSTSETMSVEVYTTKVSVHNAYIIAELKDSTKVQTATRRFYVTKKGICVNDRDMGTYVDPAALNIGWYYNWGSKSFKESKFKNDKFYDLEFVPMIYSGGGVKSIDEIMAETNKQGYKYILSYNEPDLSNEANTSASIMTLRWNDFVKYKGSMRLGSPAISTAKSPVDSDWWSSFWNGISATGKSNMSFMAVHKYYEYYDGPETAADFLTMIDETYAKYKKPIWVTEFALWRFKSNDAAGCAKAQEFMKIVCKGLDERSYVERYSWFCPDVDGDAGSSAIFDYKTGQLTTIGKIYAQIGNPAGYNAKSYGVNSTTNFDTSIAGCIAAGKAPSFFTVAKKKAFKYDIYPVKNAAGYQVQYGTKKNMKGAKTKTVKKAKGKIKIKFTKKQKKLIKKKPKKYKKITYYVRVRAYKILNGKKYYCKWSKKVKTKVKTK